MRVPLSLTDELFWPSPDQIPFNFALSARIRGPFGPNHLRLALACAAARHPLALARLEIDAQGAGWLVTPGCEAIDLRVAKEGECLEKVVEVELAKPFDPLTGPQVRAVWLPFEGGADVILIFNHTLGDGMSGAFFTRDVLRALGDPCARLEPVDVESGDLLEMIPARVGRAPFLRAQLALIHALAPLAWMVKKRLPQPFQPGPGAPPFSLITWRVGAEETDRLARRCKAEGTTVYAAVCAAWLKADAEVERRPVFNPARRWSRSLSTPVNLRAFLPGLAPDRFGLFMSTLTTRVECAPGIPFWQVARQVKAGLVNALAGDRKYHWVLRTHAALSGLSPADRRGALALLSAGRPEYDLAITNLGRLDFPERVGDLKIEALYGPLVNGFPFERTVSMLTFGGVMHFAFAWREFVMSRAAAERIKARALEILHAAVEEN